MTAPSQRPPAPYGVGGFFLPWTSPDGLESGQHLLECGLVGPDEGV